MLGAEFLAMLLLLVYVGAVAVLFLFVVMMLNVAQQNDVYANGVWLSINGDPNSHGAGAVGPSGDEANVYCHGTLVMNHSPNPAAADNLCPIPPIHCAPNTAQGSPNVFNGP